MTGIRGRCAFPWQQMVIDPTGDVTPCCYYHSYKVGRQSTALGNANGQSILDIWNGVGYRELRRVHVEGIPAGHPCDGCLAVELNGSYPHFDSGTGIVPEQGHCYIAKLSRDAMERSAAFGCRPALVEDGRVVATEFSAHGDIRQLGQGRFDIHCGHIYFSTSDNTNPVRVQRLLALRIGDEDFPILKFTYDYTAPSGLNMLRAYEEYEAGRSLMTAKPGFLGLASSVDCNIDCSHCNQNQFRAARLQLRPQVIEESMALVPYLNTFSWAGGEPFFLKPFRDFISNYDTDQNPNLIFGFTSNGTLISSKQLAHLKRFPRLSVSISIDSFYQESYEHLRAGADFATVMANLRRIAALADGHQRIVQCGMVVMKSNFGEIDKNILFAIENGIELNLSPLLQYPVAERIDLFSNFAVEAQGWQKALSRAVGHVEAVRREKRLTFDLAQPLDVLGKILREAERRSRDALRIRVDFRDPTNSLTTMRRPGLLLGPADAPLGYVLADRGAGSYWFEVARDAFAATGDVALEWSFFHDLHEPWLPLAAGKFSKDEPLWKRVRALMRKLTPWSRAGQECGTIQLNVPRFRSPARQPNARQASFGLPSADGVNNIDGSELHFAIRARELALQRMGGREQELNSGSIEQISHEGGHCYLAQLPKMVSDVDGGSLLVLSEDGVPLAYPHATHDEIRRLGSGRYSHWGTDLYFAASDNSDPQRNGRAYTFEEVPAGPQQPLFRSSSGIEQVQREIGHCFKGIISIKMTSDREGLSRLVVLEDGTPLSRGHAYHEEIRTKGSGRYSHWGDHIYFSTTDNTDALSNGRLYTIALGSVEDRQAD